jgi:hypothetical protein
MERNTGGSATVADLQEQVHRHKPDAICIPENRLKHSQRRSDHLQRALGKDYYLIHSLLPGLKGTVSRETRYWPGAAGVTLGIKKTHLAHGSLTVLPIDDHSLEGYVAHARLQPPYGRPLEVSGVYMPCTTGSMDEDGHEGNATPAPPATASGASVHAKTRQIRGAIYRYVGNARQCCEEEGSSLLLAGDVPATLHASDRPSLKTTTTDRRYRRFWLTTALCSSLAGP